MKNVFNVGLLIISCILAVTPFAYAQSTQQTSQLQSTTVAMLQAQDSIAAPPPSTTPQFFPRGFSQDGKHLLVTVSEIGEREGQGAARKIWVYLRAVNMKTGSVSTLAKIQGDIDWFAGSSGAVGAPQVTTQRPTLDNGPPWITLGEPSDQPPPNDVLESFTPGEFEGKAVYVAFVRVAGTGDQSQWRTFLVLRRAGKSANTIQTYPVQLRKGELFSPQWSPNGRQVLLKVGNAGDRYNVYLMHLWDPGTGQLRQGPPEYISHLLPRWSPDSQHIAYVTGGDIAGRFDRFTEPISLRIYDVRTGQSRMIVRNLGSADFAWTRMNTLLCTLLPQIEPQSTHRVGPNSPTKDQSQPTPRSTPQRPNIYEVTATGDAPSLVIRGGSKPIPSSDGRWIAFFGWPDEGKALTGVKDNSTSANYGPRLMLFDRDTRRRILVRPDVFQFGTQFTQMLWTPDSKRLILIQARYNTKTAQGEARISAVSMQTETAKTP